MVSKIEVLSDVNSSKNIKSQNTYPAATYFGSQTTLNHIFHIGRWVAFSTTYHNKYSITTFSKEGLYILNAFKKIHQGKNHLLNKLKMTQATA